MIQDQHGSYHAIPVQSGSIALRIKVEDFGHHNLLKLLNVFGKLYYGQVNKDYFDSLFQAKKQKFLKNLQSSSIDKYLEFQLRMIRAAQSTDWKWPACVNAVIPHGSPEWATGSNRILASGVCKKLPESTVSVLFFDQVNSTIDQWLSNPREITTDEQLHELLGTTYDSSRSPSIQISTVLKQVQQHTRLFLHGIIDDTLEGYQNSQEMIELDLLTNLRNWQANNTQPQLEIYTDWPDLISDSVGAWNYRVVGGFESLSQKIFHPGHLERLAKIEHESSETRKHVLYVKNPVKIDLSEFLIWIDENHTTFADQDWNFILYQRATGYNLKMISLSTVK